MKCSHGPEPALSAAEQGPSGIDRRFVGKRSALQITRNPDGAQRRGYIAPRFQPIDGTPRAPRRFTAA
jgi:hypothetical protein